MADVRSVVRTSVVEHKRETLIKKNVFFLVGIIDGRMSYTLLMDLVYQKLTEPVEGPMWAIINSPGGILEQGLAIYDTLQMLAKTGTQVNTVAIGDMASMAVSILQAGTRRYSLPNSQFTLHQARLSGIGDRQEVNALMDIAKELERQNKIVLQIIAERSGMPMEELFEVSKKTDFSMNAQAALKFGEHGLVDEVITSLPFLNTETAK